MRRVRHDPPTISDRSRARALTDRWTRRRFRRCRSSRGGGPAEMPEASRSKHRRRFVEARHRTDSGSTRRSRLRNARMNVSCARSSRLRGVVHHRSGEDGDLAMMTTDQLVASLFRALTSLMNELTDRFRLHDSIVESSRGNVADQSVWTRLRTSPAPRARASFSRDAASARTLARPSARSIRSRARRRSSSSSTIPERLSMTPSAARL